MKYGEFFIAQKDETLNIQVFKRVANSAYEYEQVPSLTFKGKIANNIERKQYHIQRGVNGNTDSLFIFSSNMPFKDLKVGDLIVVLGEKHYIQSIGYYINENKIVNMGLFNEDYIIEKSPKGINIQ